MLGLGALGPSAASALPGPPGPNPDGRGYELVTPLDKNGGLITGVSDSQPVAPNVQTAPDGQRLQFQLQPAALDDNPNNLGAVNFYVAERSGAGWQSTTRTPQLPPGTVAPDTADSPQPFAFSDDLTQYSFQTGWQLDLEHDQDGAFGYIDVYRWRPGGPAELVSCQPGQVCAAPQNIARTGAVSSPDLSHIVFDTAEPLLPAAPAGLQVYDRLESELRLVSQGPPLLGGAPLDATSTMVVNGSTGDRPGAISDDGSRIFFTSGGRVYVRIDGTKTFEVSRSRTANPSNGIFLGATPDGNTALIRSTAKLTADDPNTVADLYAWRYDPTTETDSVQRVASLPQVGPAGDPVANNPGPTGGTAPNNPTMADVVAMSTDATSTLRAYFAVRAGSGSTTRLDLFVATDPAAPTGSVRYVATVGQGSLIQVRNATCTGNVLSITVSNSRTTCARTTPDGRFLAFDSARAVTADDADSNFDTFVYDADAATVTRASIGAEGPTGTRGNGPFDARSVASDNQAAPLSTVTPDGTLLFATSEALVAEDANTLQDVYAFQGGQVSLVSGGAADADQPSFLLGSGADGRDVFFATESGLIPWDTDGAFDVYDARVGGGFPAPASGCFGDACQGPVPSSGAGGGGGGGGGSTPPPTATVEGSGNAVPPPLPPSGGTEPPVVEPDPRAQLLRISARQLKSLSAGRRISMRVRVNQPGRVVARLRARVNGGRRTVARGSVRASDAGNVRLSLRLSKVARRELRDKGRLRLVLVVGFRDERRADRTRLTVRSTDTSGRRAKRRSARRALTRVAAVPVITDGR